MNKPTIRDRVRERICPNCGRTPERRSPKGPPPTFCSKECKREHNNRLLVEGRAVIGFLKAWRVDRGQGEIAQKSLAQVCEITDLFNAQDLAAGRPRADIYAATLLVEGTRYFDRQRPARAGRGKPEPKPDPMQDVLEAIARGHNDPRRLAEEALGLREKEEADG